MNRDEITHVTDEDLLRMAHDARLTDPDLGEWMVDYGYSEGQIKKFAELVAAAEREACAKVCDELAKMAATPESAACWMRLDCATAIRKRGAA